MVLTTVTNYGSNRSNRACAVKGPLMSWIEVGDFSIDHTLTDSYIVTNERGGGGVTSDLN